MTALTLVVIGASAGGLEALIRLVEVLPKDLSAAIVVAIHTRSDTGSYLPTILSRRTALPVAFAEPDEELRAGRIYVAPPDFHVQVGRERLHLSRGPKENGFRPAIDPLFRSAARYHKAGVMGVVLSGGLDDGTYGLQRIKDAGGITVVQDPDEAVVTGMPRSAIQHVGPDHVLNAADIGHLIASLSGATVAGSVHMTTNDPEPQDPLELTEVIDMQRIYGPPSGLTCPDCGGALWELRNDQFTRYRCHVGHQYSSEALDTEQHEAVEAALWSAVRVLEEHAELRRRMASRADHGGMSVVADGFATSARDAQDQAAQIRDLLFARTTPQPDGGEAIVKALPAKAAKRRIRGRSSSRRSR